MTSTGELRPISEVRTSYHCPNCGRPSISRSSSPLGIVDNSGASLWAVTERCTMCEWQQFTDNVKMGA